MPTEGGRDVASAEERDESYQAVRRLVAGAVAVLRAQFMVENSRRMVHRSPQHP